MLWPCRLARTCRYSLEQSHGHSPVQRPGHRQARCPFMTQRCTERIYEMPPSIEAQVRIIAPPGWTAHVTLTYLEPPTSSEAPRPGGPLSGTSAALRPRDPEWGQPLARAIPPGRKMPATGVYGDLVTVQELAPVLAIAEPSARRWINDGRLLAIGDRTVGYWVPLWQLDDAGRPPRHLRQVVALLRSKSFDRESTARWMQSARLGVEQLAPIDLLLRDRDADVELVLASATRASPDPGTPA